MDTGETSLQNRSQSFLHLAFMGFIIGIGSIAPGFSGGIMAVSFGIYAVAIERILNIFKEFKKSFSFLFPLALGAGIGIILFGIIMKPLLEHYETSIIFTFMGLVLGSLPSLVKKSCEKGFKYTFLISLAVAFIIGFILTGAIGSFAKAEKITTLTLLISGGVLSIGMIIPGISSSFILLKMGVYDDIISAFLGFDIVFILWVILGFVIVSLLIIKFINIAFKKFHGYAYFAAMGFLLSSMISVIPSFRSGIFLVIDIALFAAGAVFVYLFMKKME